MPADTPRADEPQTAEYPLLKQAIPTWLGTTDPTTRAAFKRASTAHIDWLHGLTQAQRTQLRQYNDQAAQSQQALDTLMAGLPSVEAFAKPLLSDRLKEVFNVGADPASVYIHLRKPLLLGALAVKVGNFSTLTVTLLQAALHNFEEDECQPGAFEGSSCFRTGPGERDPRFNTPMSTHGFLRLCRNLDVGQLYQARLEQFFNSANDLPALQIKARKDALQAAAYTALLKHDIDADDYRVMQEVIAQKPDIQADGKPVWFCDLSIMNLRLSGITVFAPIEKRRYAKQLLVYIPHDPEHPLKKYPNGTALEAELTRQLMADVKAGSGPGRYQRFFANFLAYADQPTYYRRLTQDVADGPADPYAVPRSPVTQFVLPFLSLNTSLFLTPRELPPKPLAPREPIKDGNFYIRVISKRGLWKENVELWRDDFDKMCAKLKADAKSHAVPTADVDARARAKTLAALAEGGLMALNLVSMFVPVLGEVMMAVMASQLLYETFEGVMEWSEGDREAALEHLTDVAENVAMLAVMAAGGAGLRRVLKPPPVIEAVQPVTLASGAQKLWKADLAPYTAPVQPSAGAMPDALGLYPFDGAKKLLPLEGAHYLVAPDAAGEYRIQHPTRSDAYTPRLAHNGEGGWQHEAEHPLTWDDSTVLRRLGQPAQGLSAERLQQARQASGVEADALRGGHLEQAPTPLLLADSLQRLRLHDELGAFVEQLRSADPAIYAQADPALQMDTLHRRGLLPERPMRLYDSVGRLLWDDPVSTRSARHEVTLDQQALARGELLQELLRVMQGRDPELAELPGRADESLPERARQLREYIAEQVEGLKGPLVEERYRKLTASRNPDAARLQDRYPNLPGTLAEHLLKPLDDAQLAALREGAGLPPNLAEQAQWCEQEVRVARAYEGLFAEALANPDSERLAVRNQEAGQPLTRDQVRELLAQNPLRKPAYDPSMRLLGGGRGVKQWVSSAANAMRTPRARARRLFPTVEDAELDGIIASLGANVRDGLASLEEQYATLKQDLNAWVRANAPQSQVTAFDRRGGYVGEIAREIKRCWRRETTTLSIRPGRPLNLVQLTADFSHVEELELHNTPWSPQAQGFLDQFKQLKVLRINHAGLQELPQGLGERQGLVKLLLRDNRIRLSAENVEQLGRLGGLQTLDLANNPLGLTPDFTGMPNLEHIDLSHTGIEQWPTGLLDQPRLARLDLRHNRLHSVPRAHVEPAPDQLEKIVAINGVTVMDGNPFTAESAQAVDAYWRRLKQDHPALVKTRLTDAFSIDTPLIRKVLRIFPNYDYQRARDYVWSLGDDAETLINARVQEFDGLSEQLNAWVFSGGGARQRYVRFNQVLENEQARDHRFIAKSRLLSCWRGEGQPRLANDRTPIGLELDLSGLTLPSLPDLDADFSHVGSLKLNNMNLSASPEGFLARFRGLRWLDMSANQLRELPPALGEMHGLTRLNLQRNQIRLSPESAEVLAQRSSLRALWLDHNPLGITPDVSHMNDLRHLSLSHTGIDSWPNGLGTQPRLDYINLESNQIGTLPDAVIAPTDELLAQSAQVNEHVELAFNPLTQETIQRVRQYSARLMEAGVTEIGNPNRLVRTAQTASQPRAFQRAMSARWTQGLAADALAARQAQWQGLRAQPGGDGFFRMLDDLHASGPGHDALQQRVWAVIDSITEHTEASDALREQMFEWAGRPTCCDRAALSFDNVEIMSLVYKARASAADPSHALALLTLARSLFRLDEVEKTALADIARRTAAINADASLSAAEKAQRIVALEEVEIRLAYREGLKGPQRLNLPGQAQAVRFTGLGGVTAKMLDAAEARIIGLNNSPEEFQALVGRDFWQDFVTHTYRDRFDAMSRPFHDQLATLHERLEAGTLDSTQYEAQAKDLQARLAIEEAQLIQALTRDELAAHPLP